LEGDISVITSYATVLSPNAHAYLIALGRDWHRDLPQSGEMPTHVEIPFSIGHCALDVDGDQLDITLTALSERNAVLLEDLISDHLDRLSSDEDLRYQWLRPADEQGPRRRAFKLC
jgi:hypothetical protein